MNNIIPFYDPNAWVNLTAMCASYGKTPGEFLRSSIARRNIAFLRVENDGREAMAKRANGDTWAHPGVALHYAQWLEPAFHVWCIRLIFGESDPTPYLGLPIDQILAKFRESEKKGAAQ